VDQDPEADAVVLLNERMARIPQGGFTKYSTCWIIPAVQDSHRARKRYGEFEFPRQYSRVSTIRAPL